MNIRNIDLNLLAILHAVLEEAHVSRAAARLGMSQPATSSALDRCRRLFKDPLLERAGGAMRLTAKAEVLRPRLAAVIEDIARLVGVETPPLSQLRQAVHIVMADALGTYLGRTLREAVAKTAPGIDLVLHPWGGGSAALAQVARGSVDLAVSVLPPADERIFHIEPVREERYVIVMRQGHPAASDFSLERWLAWPHVIVSAEGATRTAVDEALAAIGHERRVGMVVPSFLLVPDLIRGSDLIALLPAVSVTGAAARDFSIFDPPLPIDGFTLRLAWHRRQGQNEAVLYVAREIKRLLATDERRGNDGGHVATTPPG